MIKNMPKNLNRLEKTVGIIKTEGRVSVTYLAQFFGVTEMTIYNDLKKIEDDSIILTKKDVVYTGENRIFDDPHFKRLKNNAERKKVIAGKAVKYINDFDTIFLDGSTTTHYLAKLLAEESGRNNLTVVTYSPVILLELGKNPEINLICLGGRFERVNYILLDNSHCLLESINLNRSFISSVGISPESGFTELIEGEAGLKRKLLDICPENYILADIAKFERTGTYTFGPLSKATRIIVDNTGPIMANKAFSEIAGIIE